MPEENKTPQFTPPRTTNSKLIVPSQAEEREAPKEVLERKFELDPSIMKVDGGAGIVQLEDDRTGKLTTVREEVKPAEEKKKEVKAEEKKEEKTESAKTSSVLKPPTTKKEEAKTEKKEEVVTQIAPVQKKEGDRDYSGFSQEEASLLKQMSNPAFELASKLIKENKQLVKNKEGTIYQHPDAYMLTKPYKDAQETIEFGGREAGYWMKCLQTIDEGKPFKPLIGWKDGNPVFGNEIQPTKEIEEAVRQNLADARNGVKNAQNQLSQIQAGFQNEIKNTAQAIQTERAKRFAWAEKPELLDYTVSVGGGQEKSIKQIKQDFYSIFPAYFHNDPILEVASDLMVAMVIQKAQLDEATSGQRVAEVKQEELKRGEPTSTVKPAPQPEFNGKVREFSTAGMPT